MKALEVEPVNNILYPADFFQLWNPPFRLFRMSPGCSDLA
jgi:hypothetical protein